MSDNVSACQNKHSSCGACCGINNLDLSGNARVDLLRDRTNEFERSVQFMVDSSYVAYRAERERAESTIARHSSETYACPFLGFISENRQGCLIHPLRTGREDSQNFSFYGKSICQGYDCPNKQKDLSGRYAEFLDRFYAKDYGRLMGDTRFYSLLAREPGFELRLKESLELNRPDGILASLVGSRLQTPDSQRVTSFELTQCQDEESELESVFSQGGAEYFSALKSHAGAVV